MPSQHFVPRFAQALHASPRVQANALTALALSPDEAIEAEWGARAAAALLIASGWEGQNWSRSDVAKATGVPEQAVAKQYEKMAATLKNARR